MGRSAKMMPATPAALGDSALRRGAGEAVFGRGQAYAAQDRCAALREGDASSDWLVRGSDDYRVELAIEGGQLRAACTCPHAEDGAFCKHMVAAALAWRARLAGSLSTSANPDPMLAFLQDRPAAELAVRLLAWAGRDRTLAAELKAWRAEHAPAAEGAWKEALDAALRKTRSFYDVVDSGGYARQGQRVLPLLRALAKRNPREAREACVLALRRIFTVSEHADDSNGSIGDLLHSVHDVLLDVLAAEPPTGADAQRWLRTWFALQGRDPWGLWDDEGMVVAAGPQVRALYSRQVAQDWQDWLSRRSAAAPSDAWDAQRWRARSRYLGDRRHAGDVAAVLQALRSDLRGGDEVVDLAATLQGLGREREAVQVLEQGVRKFRDDWRLEGALLAAYERDGCREEALALRRRQLERCPDVANYAAVLQAAEAAGLQRAAYRSELHRWAEAAERTERPELRRWRASAAAGTDVTVRMRWLLHDGEPAHALALARQPGCVAAELVLRELAGALRDCDLEAADAIFRRLVESCMRRASTPYREELAIVEEWLGVLPATQAAERLAWMRETYRAKRNFVAGLEKLAPR